MRVLPFSTREAVASDTPAASATCCRVAPPRRGAGEGVDRCMDTLVIYRLGTMRESAFRWEGGRWTVPARSQGDHGEDRSRSDDAAAFRYSTDRRHSHERRDRADGLPAAPAA